jgi:hypothetical protein
MSELWDRAYEARARAGDLAAQATEANAEADRLEDEARAGGSQSDDQAAADAREEQSRSDHTAEHYREILTGTTQGGNWGPYLSDDQRALAEEALAAAGGTPPGETPSFDPSVDPGEEAAA